MKRLYRVKVTTTRVLYLLADDGDGLRKQVLAAHRQAERDGCNSHTDVDSLMRVQPGHIPDCGWDRHCLVYGDTGEVDVKLGEALEVFTKELLEG